MALKFPNRTEQAAVYKTGSPNYVDASSGVASAGMVTFGTQASGGYLADGDTVGVLVAKDVDNYQVWTATWVAATSLLQATTVEATVGALADNDAVTVTACMTAALYDAGFTTPQHGQFVADSGTTRSLAASDAGKTICFTSASAVTVTLTATLPTSFHCILVQEGAGTVSVARDSTDTINGGTSNVSLLAQYTSAYVYQRTEGAWIVVK